MQDGKTQPVVRSRLRPPTSLPILKRKISKTDVKNTTEEKLEPQKTQRENTPKQSTLYKETVSSKSKIVQNPEGRSNKTQINSNSSPKNQNNFLRLFSRTTASERLKRESNIKRKEELSIPTRVSSEKRPIDDKKDDDVSEFVSTSNLKLAKNINNNDVWSEVAKPHNSGGKSSELSRLRKSSIPRGGAQTPSSKRQENSGLKGAASVSSLDSKHHKVAPTKEKSSKVFGSKDKLHKSKKKEEIAPLETSNEILDEEERVSPIREMESADLTDASNLKKSKNNNQIEFSSTDELPERGLFNNKLSGSTRSEKIDELVSSNDDILAHQEFASLPPMPMDTSIIEDHVQNGPSQIEYEIVSVEKTEEIETLRKELQLITGEKLVLEEEVKKILEQLQEMTDLKKELSAIKTANERISTENAALRARLRGVAHSPLSDNEKRQLLQDAGHNSGPASMPTETDGDVLTPEWDKHSSSSLSEVSVACLQDRILQMEENHYSTNEELQATLQELADLQTQLTELHVDNERLSDEKAVLLESLCTQTEKLEDTRTRALTLQELLLREGSEQEICTTEREQKLVMLWKSVQAERESLLVKQEELKTENSELRETLGSTVKENEKLHEKIKNLECSSEVLNTELKQAQIELKATKDLANARHVQLQHVSDLFDAATNKLSMIDSNAANTNTDQQTIALQRQTETLQEQLSAARRQHDRLAHRCSQLQEEAAIAKNAANSNIADLEYQCDQLRQDKQSMNEEYLRMQELNNDLQLHRQCLIEERKSSQNALNEAQRTAATAEQRCCELQARLNAEITERERDAAEWKQFQSDLLTTVRVANDFKTEAQRELEKLVFENRAHRERVRALETQLEQLKVPNKVALSIPRSASVEESSHITIAPSPLLTSASLQDIMASAQSVQRRNKVGATRQDSRLSVKSLIESIENAAKQAKAGAGLSGSLASSTSSFNSLLSGDNFENQINQQHSGSPLRDRTSSPTDLPKPSGSPLNNSGSSINTGTPITNNGYNSTSPSSKPLSYPRNHRNAALANDQLKQDGQGHVTPAVKCTTMNSLTGTKLPTTTNMTDDQTSSVHSLLQNNKALETFVRRNSYGDLSDRKDPLNGLVKNGGSKRNALLKWCQNKTVGYRNIDITNFSSSWNDGLALCALLHTYLPSLVPYDSLPASDKKHNFSTAFAAAESVGIPTTLNIQDMIQLERPDWQQVMAYVTAIYKHFET